MVDSESRIPVACNDEALLVLRTEFEGPVLEFDFPALHIGVGEYEEGPTGCTVFYFPDGASCETDIRGGSPGVVKYGTIDAICLAGGSLYGLEASTGVAAEIFKQHGYNTRWDSLAAVAGAIIYDFRVRHSAIYPDKDLGRAALSAAKPGGFPLGPRGAGRSASVGKSFEFYEGEPGGQGGAFRQVGETKIAVFSVVNAMGAVVDRDGNIVRGHLDPDTGDRHTFADGMQRAIAEKAATSASNGNTTLTVVVINQNIGSWHLRQLGRQVHASMSRVIQPFHCRFDGDVLFAVSTNEIEDESLDPTILGHIASELAWDAVLCAVDPPEAPPKEVSE